MNKFPILGSEPKEYIPLDIIKVHEKQAIRNHGQTLKRLAERGGLGWVEALCVLEDREYDFHTKLTEVSARTKVLEIVDIEKEGRYNMSMDRNTQAIEDLRHLSEVSEIFAYQNESIEVAVKALEKQIPYKLTQRDKETLTGICKCGRATEIIDCEHYCKYCGQKVI